MTWPNDFPSAQQIAERLQGFHDDTRFSALTEISNLAPTHENRTAKVIRIGRLDAGAANRNKVLFTGGVHAREWVPPRALTTLVEKLLEAKHSGSAIAIGGANFTPANVTAIFEHVDLFVAPMINPDGYEFSRTPGHRSWRKNRSPAPPIGTTDVTYGSCGPGDDAARGADVNRNFDVLWKFQDFYIEGGRVQTSDDPCQDIFRGTAAWSEVESRNVKTLLDREPQFFVDCHMDGQFILHPWGVEQNRSVPGDTPALDLHRVRDGTWDPATTPGTHGFNGYAEPIGQHFLAEVRGLAGLMSDTIRLATGADYQPQPGSQLTSISGAADDFATSRNLGTARPPIKAFTLECGPDGTRFFVDFASEYPAIEREVHAALLALLRHAAVPPSSPHTGQSCCDCRG